MIRYLQPNLLTTLPGSGLSETIRFPYKLNYDPEISKEFVSGKWLKRVGKGSRAG